MSDANRIVQAAQFLLEEHRTRQSFGPLPALCAARTVDEAYAVQEAFHALRAATHGPIAGYKIALTTPVMQQMVGFHEPVSGAILAKTMQQSPCTIRSTDYGRLGVECEIAVRLEADLPVTPAPYSRDHIAAAIGAVLSGQARASTLGKAWTEQLEQLADASTDSDVLNTVGCALGMETFESQRALSLTDIILFLKRIPLYDSMTLDQLRTIATHLTERDMFPGESIFHEGDSSYELYLIVSGKVDIVKHFGATPRTLATLHAGDFFGEMAIFEDRPRSADAVGAAQGILLVLSPERFRQVVLQDPAISFEIFRVLSARLRRFDEEAFEAARSLEAH